MVLLPPADEGSASLLQLLILAVVQGISEFLPVSSDGHLVLVQSWLGLPGPHLGIDVALHLGTLLSVLVVFRRELLALARDRRELALILAGTVPAGVIGIGFREAFARLFESHRAAAWGLLVTAGFLFVGEAARRAAARRAVAPRPVGLGDALWIGTFQALAILPGVSRSGVTIVTGLVRGLPARDAARFSFLLSVPAIAGAVLLEVPDLARSGGFSAELWVAIAATFVVGVGALRVLLAFLGRGAFLWLGLYCLTLGIAVLVLW